MSPRTQRGLSVFACQPCGRLGAAMIMCPLYFKIIIDSEEVVENRKEGVPSPQMSSSAFLGTQGQFSIEDGPQFPTKLHSS